MKHLLMTTALVAFTALPGMAQTDTTPQTGQNQTQNQTQGQAQAQDQLVLGETFQASELIGKRLMMPVEGAEGADATMGDQAPSQAEPQPDDQNDQANVEGDADDKAAPGLQSDDANTDTAMNDGNGATMNQNRDNWQMVGEIRDVILNADGDAEGLVVDSGGFLGMDANRLRISMQDVRFVPEDHQQAQDQQAANDAGDFWVVYTGDRAAFETAEPFDEARAGEAGEVLGSADWEMDERQQKDISFSDITTDELLGAPVYGADNEWLGEVSELALGQNGEIDTVIIDVGGFLGIGEKPVALNMDSVKLRLLDDDELRAYVPHTEDELDAMETWEDDTDL